MASISILALSIFPYDPAIDTPLGHRDLILIYCLTAVFHLAYVTYIGLKWRALDKEDSGASESSFERGQGEV
jgi:hypothetical protein